MREIPWVSKIERSETAAEAVARRCSIKKGVLKNFAKSTGIHLCQSLFLNKVAGLSPASASFRRQNITDSLRLCPSE